MIANFSKSLFEAGCDEAGRGSLAGPVSAAAVILPKDFPSRYIDDSKALSKKQRTIAARYIKRFALAWAISMIDEKEIDHINIRNASIRAMHQALHNLTIKPGFVIVDGNHFEPYAHIPYQCIIKGDKQYASIAAASILAKTHRDTFMAELDHAFPRYGWAQNKGYPTKAHRYAIRQYGTTPYHRQTFRLLPD